MNCRLQSLRANRDITNKRLVLRWRIELGQYFLDEEKFPGVVSCVNAGGGDHYLIMYLSPTIHSSPHFRGSPRSRKGVGPCVFSHQASLHENALKNNAPSLSIGSDGSAIGTESTRLV